MDVQTLAQDERTSCGTEIDFHFDKERRANEETGWHDILSLARNVECAILMDS